MKPLLAAAIAALLALGVGALPGFHVWALTAVTVVVSGWIMHREVGLRIDRLSIPGFWYLTYLAMILVPGVFVYFNEPGIGRGTFLIAIHVAAVAVPLSVMAVNRVTAFRRAEIEAFYRRPLTDEVPEPVLRLAVVTGFAGGLALMALYVVEAPSIPLVHMIRNPGDYATLVLLREESFKLLDSRFLYAYDVLRAFGLPFLAMLALASWLHYRTSFWKWTLMATASAAILFAAFATAKGPVAVVVLLLLLVRYLERSGRLSWRTLVFGAAFLFLFPLLVLLGLSGGGGGAVAIAMTSILRRVFYAPAWTLFFYFESFPGFVGHLGGRSIGRLADVMGWQFFDTANYVALHAEGSWVASASANAAFLGNLWADWGWVGIILGSLAAGVIMQVIQVYFTRRPKSIPSLVSLAYLLFAFWLLHSTALSVVLASGAVAVVPFIPFVFRATAELLQRSLGGVPASRAHEHRVSGVDPP